MDSNLPSKNEKISHRDLTVQENVAIDQMKQRRKEKPVTIFKVTQTDDSETLSLAHDENLASLDKDQLMDTQIMEATGAANSDVGIQLLLNVGTAIVSTTDRSKMATQLNAVAQSMQALGPQDEYEGQLIAQLVVLHEQAMNWLGRAQRTERVDFANIYLNGASKLLARHHETLEALLKYRRKGEQRVHVEHVHVHDGGQAIVGNVIPGGGMNQKLEEGPHAKV